jgi:hypothetical protein
MILKYTKPQYKHSINDLDTIKSKIRDVSNSLKEKLSETDTSHILTAINKQIGSNSEVYTSEIQRVTKDYIQSKPKITEVALSFEKTLLNIFNKYRDPSACANHILADIRDATEKYFSGRYDKKKFYRSLAKGLEQYMPGPDIKKDKIIPSVKK